RAAAARAIRRRARRGREGPQRVRVRQPALQQPHELGDRQQGRDQACLCLRRLLPSCSRSPSLQNRRWPSLRGWENRFRRPRSKHGTSAFSPTVPVCRPAAAPPNKAPKSTRRSAWRARRRRQGWHQCTGGWRPPIKSIDATKTVANFWGYSTTVFDYVRRAMPWMTPRTLTDDEVYALTAFILARNKIIGDNDVMNAQTLPKVKMPNADNFTIKFPDKI